MRRCCKRKRRPWKPPLTTRQTGAQPARPPLTDPPSYSPTSGDSPRRPRGKSSPGRSPTAAVPGPGPPFPAGRPAGASKVRIGSTPSTQGGT